MERSLDRRVEEMEDGQRAQHSSVMGATDILSEKPQTRPSQDRLGLQTEEIEVQPRLSVLSRDTLDSVDFDTLEKEDAPARRGTTARRDTDRTIKLDENGIPIDGRPETALSANGTVKDTASSASKYTPLKREASRLANKKTHPLQHIGITLGLPMIILFDIVIPCIIYYTWYNKTKSNWERNCRETYHVDPRDCPVPKPEFDKDILGYAIICFGFGELYILIVRAARLWCHPEVCAPLLNRNRWEFDATTWVYAVAMLMALIPFVTSSTLEIPKLYLYSPSFLMGFLGVLMVITTFIPFKIPVGINSHPRGSGLRPFIYYAAEDFIAVDGLQDREFRERYNARYETDRAFRQMFVYLTLWWELGVLVYFGALSAVIWTLEFHIAFGLSLGILFSYIALWAAASYAYVTYEMARQKRIHEAGAVQA
nr:hypothetical protein CFP56_32466 [Quercus suber]